MRRKSKLNLRSVLTRSTHSMRRRTRMVGFELLTHLLNMAICNSLVNEMLCCILFMGVVNISCVFPSVLWSQRFIQPLSLAAGFFNTLLFFLNKHSPFHNGGFSVSMVGERQCGPHCVFCFMYKGDPSRVTYLLISLLLGYYSTKAIFFHERAIYMSFEADFNPRCIVCQRD